MRFICQKCLRLWASERVEAPPDLPFAAAGCKTR